MPLYLLYLLAKSGKTGYNNKNGEGVSWHEPVRKFEKAVASCRLPQPMRVLQQGDLCRLPIVRFLHGDVTRD